MLDQQGDLSADLTAVVDRVTALDPASMTGTQAAALAQLISAQEQRLAAARLAALNTVDSSGVWGLDGSRSAAAWLAREHRCSKPAAGADLKTARLMSAHLPATATALAAGALSVDQAKAITRTCLRTPAMIAMLDDPERGEGFLLAHTHLCVEDYQRFLNAWAYRVDPEAADASYREAKDGHVLYLHDTPSGTVPSGLLDPVAAEGLRTLLRAETGVPTADDTRTPAQRRHDALASIVARVLGGGQLGWHASTRPQVVVHVPYATLTTNAGDAGAPPAWLQESKAPIPRTVLDRVLCDSAVTRVIFGPQGQVLDVGRTQRTFTGPRRRALDAHDGGCMYPGCDLPPSACEGHHRSGWANGALTDATDEGILLCYVHHPYVHDHGISIERDARGWWVFTDRHGQIIGASQPRSLDPTLYDPWDDSPSAA